MDVVTQFESTAIGRADARLRVQRLRSALLEGLLGKDNWFESALASSSPFTLVSFAKGHPVDCNPPPRPLKQLLPLKGSRGELCPRGRGLDCNHLPPSPNIAAKRQASLNSSLNYALVLYFLKINY